MVDPSVMGGNGYNVLHVAIIGFTSFQQKHQLIHDLLQYPEIIGLIHVPDNVCTEYSLFVYYL